jgi:SulP family sulfate permease
MTTIKAQTGSQLTQTFRPDQLLPGLTAGVINGILSIIVQISFAVMIFGNKFPAYVATGIGLTLFGGFIIGLITILASSFNGSVALVQDGPTAILAVTATAIVAAMATSATQEEQFLTLVAVIIISSLLTGIFLFVLGRYKLGFLVQFLPYPVIGGFLAGTGWLLVLGGIGIATDMPLSFSQIPCH